jgi:hypothetical protein
MSTARPACPATLLRPTQRQPASARARTHRARPLVGQRHVAAVHVVAVGVTLDAHREQRQRAQQLADLWYTRQPFRRERRDGGGWARDGMDGPQLYTGRNNGLAAMIHGQHL